MIQYGRLVAVKQICPQPVAEGRLFQEDPVQNQQAQIVTTTVTSIDATLDIPKTPTGQWLLRSTDPNSFIDPFQPAEVKAKEEEIPKAKKVTYKVPLPPMISKLSTKRARIARGVGSAKTAKAQSSTERDNEFADLKTGHQTSEENKLPSIQGSRLLPHLRYLAKEQALEEESLPITGSIGLPPHQKSPLRKPALEEICAPSLPVGLPPHQQSLRKENQAMINDHGSINQIGSEQTLVGEESQAASSNPGPPIATPYLPRMAIPGPSPSESGWKLVDKGRAGRLIDTSEPIEEKVQAPEKDRTLKRTMGQKAPSHKLPGGSTALFKGFDDAAIKLLNLALYCQGPIDFEVGIGRLLIDPSKGSMEFKNKAFSISEWSSAFPTSSSIGPITLETHFASRLTTSSSDIQSILDIPLSQGRRLFNDRGAPRKVSYVFLCKSKDDKQIVIDIDEDGTFKVRFSSIDRRYNTKTGRYWDPVYLSAHLTGTSPSALSTLDFA